MKRTIISVILTLLGCMSAVLAWTFYDPSTVISHLIHHVLAESAGASSVSSSRFEVLFVGTGSPNHSIERGQPCLAVVANGKLFLFDVGEGSLGTLKAFHAPLMRLETIFLTHLHSDHISGLGEVLHNTWLFGRTHDVEVIGPPGTSTVAQGYAKAYEPDILERERALGPENFDPDVAMGSARDVLLPINDSEVVYDEQGVLVEAFRVDHPEWNDAYGYRISYGGKIVVISGDTRRSANVAAFAVGADVLVHEALHTDAMQVVAEAITKHDVGMQEGRVERIVGVHTTTIEVAEIAQEAGVKHVALTHLIPALPPNLFTDRYFTSGMRDLYDGKITVARDGMRIVLAD